MWLLVAIGCKPSTPVAEDLVAAARDQGPYMVGHTTLQVDAPQVGGDPDRFIDVEVWYPTEATGSTTVYTVAGVASVASPAATEGPDAIAGPVPVAVYSHGSGGVGALGYPYGEHLASHGWLVLAPSHKGNTTDDFLTGEVQWVRSALDRPMDIQAVLDAVDAGEVPIEGDTDAVMLVGHSFGGFTSFAAGGATLDAASLGPFCPNDSTDPDCVLQRDDEVLQAVADDAFADPRIAAIVPQAPAIFGFASGSIAAMDVPVLMMSGGRDRTTPNSSNAREAWQELDGASDRWLQVPDGGHYTFFSLCEDVDVALLDSLIGVSDDGCGEDFVAVSEVVPAFAAYITAWGGWHITGEPAWEEVFTGEALHPGMQVQQH